MVLIFYCTCKMSNTVRIHFFGNISFMAALASRDIRVWLTGTILLKLAAVNLLSLTASL